MQKRWMVVSWLLSFAVIGSAVAAFGVGCIIAVAITFGVAAFIRWHKTLWRGVASALAIVFCLFLLLLLLLTAVSEAGPKARCWVCKINLKQIAFGLQNYHKQYGCFPPQYTADKDGHPMHSWRAIVLPYIEGEKCWKQYRFDEPWDGPNNCKLTDRPRGYACPLDSAARLDGSTKTSYVAVVGPKTAWRGGKPTKLDALPDHGRNTLLLVETANSDIDWRQPVDLTVEQAAAGINREPGPSISSRHVYVYDDYFHHPLRGVNIAFADGHVSFVPADLPPEKLQSLLAGDPVPEAEFDELLRAKPNWWNIWSFASFVIVSLAFIFRPRAKTQQKR